MERRSFSQLLKRIFIPAPQADEEKRYRASVLYFLLLVLLVACFGLIITELLRKEMEAAIGLEVAGGIILCCLLLTRFGQFVIPSHVVPTAILFVNLYIIFVGRGIHDIAILGLAMNIALSGLLLGKRGVIVFTILSFLGLAGVYLAEVEGILENALPFRELTSPSDLFIMGTLLVTTGALIFFAIHTLDHNLKNVRRLKNELEQRVAERTCELRAANEHLTALSRVKDEFVSNVSHELRTPLTSINLHLDLLHNQPERVNQHIEQLRREVGRLEHVINDLLTLSRLDQDRVPVEMTPIDLNRLAEQYLIDRTPIASTRQINLTLEQQADLPFIEADERLVGQVLSILLTNAMDYTPAGGRVTIRTWEAETEGMRWAGFSIIDNGQGISIEEQVRVFERFYRGKAGYESGVPGTGLGLAIAREIVGRHRGRIEVQSTGIPGEGTTFRVWLPAR
jgi:signal transduction histidine kinase